jgi:hypothetical protein
MSKAVWDAFHTKVFCDICMDEVNANNRDGGCLSRKGYKNVEEKFFEKTGARLVKKQFKNKWDALKKDYTGWMELLNATGLGWDPETKTMDADDDWWKNHIAVSYYIHYLSCFSLNTFYHSNLTHVCIMLFSFRSVLIMQSLEMGHLLTWCNKMLCLGRHM